MQGPSLTSEVDILRHTAFSFPQKGEGGGWENPFLLLFTTLALKYFLLLERETTVLSLRLWIQCKIPCMLDLSSQISVFPLQLPFIIVAKTLQSRAEHLSAWCNQATALQPDYINSPTC